MPIYSLSGISPTLPEDGIAWLAPEAHVIGRVRLGRDVGIWFGAVLRGDAEDITIGDGSNIQDGAVLHADPGKPLVIGTGCTIGHRAIVHGCTLGDNVLVGMGATILNGAQIGSNSLIGANALITEGKTFPERSLIVGAPAKVVRQLSDAEVEALRQSAVRYVANAKSFAASCEKL